MDFKVLLLNTLLGVGANWREIGEAAAKKLVREALLDQFERVAPKVAKKVRMNRTTRERIREAQYWLWKYLVRSGEVADAFRDAHDDYVVPTATRAIEAAEAGGAGPVSALELVGLVIAAELEISQ